MGVKAKGGDDTHLGQGSIKAFEWMASNNPSAGFSLRDASRLDLIQEMHAQIPNSHGTEALVSKGAREKDNETKDYEFSYSVLSRPWPSPSQFQTPNSQTPFVSYTGIATASQFSQPCLGLALAQKSLSLQHLAAELDQKHRLPGPHLALPDGVRRHAGGEVGPIAHALDDASHERSAVQLAHLLGHADVLVDQGFVVNDHVLVRRLGVGALLQPVGLPPEQVLPDVLLDEVQQSDDGEGPQLRPRGFAVDKEVEQLQPDGVALDIQSVEKHRTHRQLVSSRPVSSHRFREGCLPLLQLLDALDAPLRIRHHLAEQVGEAGLAQLGRLGAVEGPVVDGLAVAGVPQAGLLAGWRTGLEVGHGRLRRRRRRRWCGQQGMLLLLRCFQGLELRLQLRRRRGARGRWLWESWGVG